jgi:hypothetical protein
MDLDIYYQEVSKISEKDKISKNHKQIEFSILKINLDRSSIILFNPSLDN